MMTCADAELTFLGRGTPPVPRRINLVVGLCAVPVFAKATALTKAAAMRRKPRLSTLARMCIARTAFEVMPRYSGPQAIGSIALRVVRHAISPSPDLDRKSTRLNSSHANISYAVFCLKKKEKLNGSN